MVAAAAPTARGREVEQLVTSSGATASSEECSVSALLTVVPRIGEDTTMAQRVSYTEG